MSPELLDYIQKLSINDKKTLSQKALKVADECGELAKVTLPFDNAHNSSYRFVDKKNILEEAVDVMLTAISMPYDLGYTHEEIEEMIWAKAKKWDGKQNKEKLVSYPIPYEIHITVRVTDDSMIEKFKNICNTIEVKPIIIDLDNGGETVMRDVMTSSNFIGDNTTAYYAATGIANTLKRNGFEVIRTKIETVPWHPAAPQRDGEDMPRNCYFEAHVSCIITEKDKEYLAFIAKRHDSHISRNAFKKLGGGKFVNMVTFRKYDGTYNKFTDELEALTNTIKDNDIEYDKVITEFSIYDTKVSHDFIWFDNVL